MIEPTLDKTNNITFKDFCYDIAHQLNIFDEEKMCKLALVSAQRQTRKILSDVWKKAVRRIYMEDGEIK